MVADGNTIRHMIEPLKSASLSQEASPITHNLNTQRLAVGSYRKFSESLGTYVSFNMYICKYNKILTVKYVYFLQNKIKAKRYDFSIILKKKYRIAGYFQGENFP